MSRADAVPPELAGREPPWFPGPAMPVAARDSGPAAPTTRVDAPCARGRRLLILEADDLGLLYAFNEGIRAAYREGALTSTCLRANGYAYEHALAEVLPACPALGVGVHLCLNEAEPVAPPHSVPLLLDARGALRSGVAWLLKVARTRAGLAQIEREFRAQIERVLDDGLRPDHLNSHQHVHMLPAIFRLTCRLAREYSIACVRLTRELPYGTGGLKRVQPYVNSNFLKHVLLNRAARVNEMAARRFDLPTTDYFVGVNYTAHMSLRAVLSGLTAAAYGSVEMLLHPALGPDPRDVRYPTPSVYKYATARQRNMELESLRSAGLSDFIQREGWTALTFAAWTRARLAHGIRMTTPPVPEDARQLCGTVHVDCPLWVSAAQEDSRVFAQLALTQTRPGQRVLDLGTGTGILGICLAKFGRIVVATDISGPAVRTARANAARNGVQLECHQSDLLSAVAGTFDFIAFNLPYAFRRDNVLTNMAKHVLRQVPWVRQHSGLALPRTVLRYHQQLVTQLMEQVPAHLAPGGAVLLHAFESEVEALAQVLPAGAHVELVKNGDLSANRTVGMLIRLGSADGRP
jgi:chitin disaccharide deacetylase